MKSKFLSLNIKDFFKGLIVAILSAVITFAYETLQTGDLFTPESLKKMGLVALATLFSYLLKNLFSNNNDELFKADKYI